MTSCAHRQWRRFAAPLELPRRGLAALALALALAWPSPSRADDLAADRVRGLIEGLSYDAARNELAAADPSDRALAVERARLALYQLDCDSAAAVFDGRDLQSVSGSDWLAETSRGCQRVIAATVVDRDEERSIEIHWQNEHDRALAPWVFDTVAKARDTLTRDLGVDWPKPTSIVVVSDLLSLSAMTTLPYRSAQTTGTVAVAKWGRVTLLSPRASHHGYPWLDTIAHELTHLAVTRATGDRAPLWLQEGIAKREEVRWRNPGPFDDRPSASAVVRLGFQAGLAIPLDRLGPSIAMLPSAEAARVAFAEVTSFVGFYAADGQVEALPRLLAQFREGKSSDDALVAASGFGMAEWSRRWRARVMAEVGEPRSADWDIGRPRVRETRAFRQGARIAALLAGRSHWSAALERFDAAVGGSGSAGSVSDQVIQDPSVVSLRARLLEETDRVAEAEFLVVDPRAVTMSFGPWWAIRGRLACAAGDVADARDSFDQALSTDPMDEDVACDPGCPIVQESRVADSSTRRTRLCEAARAAAGSAFDVD
jgi:hypothetical protein